MQGYGASRFRTASSRIGKVKANGSKTASQCNTFESDKIRACAYEGEREGEVEVNLNGARYETKGNEGMFGKVEAVLVQVLVITKIHHEFWQRFLSDIIYSDTQSVIVYKRQHKRSMPLLPASCAARV